MADTGLAIQRAKDKTTQMQARAGAIDELMASGALDDMTTDQTDLDKQLAQISSQSQVDSELASISADGRFVAFTSEATLSHAGRLFGTARRVIAPDGMSMVITFRQEGQPPITNVSAYTKVGP